MAKVVVNAGLKRCLRNPGPKNPGIADFPRPPYNREC